MVAAFTRVRMYQGVTTVAATPDSFYIRKERTALVCEKEMSLMFHSMYLQGHTDRVH